MKGKRHEKVLCLFWQLCLFIVGATAFAAELEAEIPEEDVSLADAELDVSDEETECFDVLESDEPTAEEMDSGEGTVSPWCIPRPQQASSTL